MELTFTLVLVLLQLARPTKWSLLPSSVLREAFKYYWDFSP